MSFIIFEEFENLEIFRSQIDRQITPSRRVSSGSNDSGGLNGRRLLARSLRNSQKRSSETVDKTISRYLILKTNLYNTNFISLIVSMEVAAASHSLSESIKRDYLSLFGKQAVCAFQSNELDSEFLKFEI